MLWGGKVKLFKSTTLEANVMKTFLFYIIHFLLVASRSGNDSDHKLHNWKYEFHCARWNTLSASTNYLLRKRKGLVERS